MKLSLRSLSCLWSLLLLAAWATPANSQEATVAESAEPAVEASASAGEEETAETDSFPFPDDLETAGEYIELLPELMRLEPADRSRETMKEHGKKLARTVLKLSNRILELEPEKAEELQGYSLQLQALNALDSLGESGSEERMLEIVDHLRSEKRARFKALGMRYYIELGFSKWGSYSKEEKQEKLKELKAFVKEGKADGSKLNMVLDLSRMLQANGDTALAKSLVEDVVPKFEESDNPGIVRVAGKLSGLVRRLGLPGNEIELSGTLLDGSELDWESYRGKVVLVDFWATWCPPCRAELPNVLQQYELYHDRGFDVLGISLDDDQEELDRFIEENGIPWANLFSTDEEHSGYDHPMATRYGVMGIPQTILVDSDGKVVSLSARGPELERLLKDLFSESAEPQAGTAKSESDAS